MSLLLLTINGFIGLARPYSDDLKIWRPETWVIWQRVDQKTEHLDHRATEHPDHRTTEPQAIEQLDIPTIGQLDRLTFKGTRKSEI